MNNIVKKLSFVLLCITTLSLCAQPQITRTEAIKVATNTLKIINRDSNNESVWIVDSVFTLDKSGNTLMYEVHFTTGESVLLSGHRGCLPVIGYIGPVCGTGNISTCQTSLVSFGEKIPDGLKDIIQGYVEQVGFCFENAIDAYYADQWEKLQRDTVDQRSITSVYIPPMLTTIWGQDKSNDHKHNYVDPVAYNAYTPSGTHCYHCYAGCGAVAMAQIIKYYNHPYEVPHICVRPDWNNMPDSLRQWKNNDYSIQKHAVAELISNVGLALNTVYCSDTSAPSAPESCQSTIYGLNQVVKALNSFGYADVYPYYEFQCSNHEEWANKIALELFYQRPLFYIAYGHSGGKYVGHAFVCDGYLKTDSLKLFHFNWGGNGHFDGWFPLDNLNPGTAIYNDNHGAVFGIYPTNCFQNIIMECNKIFSLGTNRSYSVVDSFQNNQYVYMLRPGARVGIQAGAEILLTNGFYAKTNSDFYASITPCSSTATYTSIGFAEDTDDYPPADTISAPKSLQTEASFANDRTLTVHPNPTDDILYIELSGSEIANVALYDLQGRVAGTNNYSPQQGITTINVRNVPAGVYVLRVTDTEGKEHHQKIVKK